MSESKFKYKIREADSEGQTLSESARAKLGDRAPRRIKEPTTQQNQQSDNSKEDSHREDSKTLLQRIKNDSKKRPTFR